MSNKPKKRFFTSHAKSSAMVVSLIIHAGLIVLAGTFVAVKVIIREDAQFEDRAVRPRQPIKKIKAPVKMRKKPKPKLQRRIVSNRKVFSNIRIPEITGVKDGLGGMGGDDLGGFGFDLDLGGIFGRDKAVGNELIGTFYDLKLSNKGKSTKMTLEKYDEVIRRFLGSWNEKILKNYFSAPKKKYAVAFMVPEISANAAPKAYGVGDVVKPMQWLAHYTGEILPPKTGRYRFCGQGDDILYVRVKNRLVLDASWPNVYGRLSRWKSDDENNRKFQLSNNKMVIGDWFNLKKGQPVKVEILFGERPGGAFCCQLLIEEKGAEYRMVPYTYKEETGTRPVLPIFKMVDIPEKIQKEMKVVPDQATFYGPKFGM